jgi:hypothetical protein
MEYSYYGRNDGKNATVGVAYMMIDDHLRKIISFEEELFKNNLKEFMKAYRIECASEVIKLKKDITKLKTKLQELQDYVKNVKLPIQIKKVISV